MKPIPTNIPLGKYHHFKGGEYQLLAIARDSENPDNFIAVYKALYGEGEVWTRPLYMFTEVITREGKEIQRFTYCKE